MSDEIGRFFSHLNQTAAAAAPLPQSVSIRFILGGAGTWRLRTAGSSGKGGCQPEVDTSEERVLDPVDCSVSCELSTLLDLARGRVKPLAALMRGLLTIRGDRGAFMQVSSSHAC